MRLVSFGLRPLQPWMIRFGSVFAVQKGDRVDVTLSITNNYEDMVYIKAIPIGANIVEGNSTLGGVEPGRTLRSNIRISDPGGDEIDIKIEAYGDSQYNNKVGEVLVSIPVVRLSNPVFSCNFDVDGSELCGGTSEGVVSIVGDCLSPPNAVMLGNRSRGGAGRIKYDSSVVGTGRFIVVLAAKKGFGHPRLRIYKSSGSDSILYAVFKPGYMHGDRWVYLYAMVELEADETLVIENDRSVNEVLVDDLELYKY